MKRKLLSLFYLLCLVSACNKREYPPEQVKSQTAEIFISGSVGNESLDLKVGEDGYYCYSAYKQRSDSVYMFEGELRKFDCNLCYRALKVELSDYIQRSSGASVLPDSVFRTGRRGFLSNLEKINTLRFESYFNKNISSIKWTLSDGTSSQSPVLNHEFNQPGPYTITLTVRSTENCESTVVNSLFAGGENGIFACSVSTTLLQNKTAAFTANIIGGKPPYTYTWNFGDNVTSSAPNPTHNYQWSGGYLVKLKIEDADDNICETDFIHIVGNDLSSCAGNMSLSLLSVKKNSMLNGVKIRWTDAVNNFYSSGNIAQPSGAYFEIINSQPYVANERGEAGRLLTMRINALLSDGENKIWFKSDNTSIAVTYK